MRISDWSSDVCSSDLHEQIGRITHAAPGTEFLAAQCELWHKLAREDRAMRLANRRWAVARILFGLFFLYAPLMVIVQFGGQNPPETMPAASDFASALDRTGFMNPLIIGTMLMGGAALLFERSAPFGLILLGPSTAELGREMCGEIG